MIRDPLHWSSPRGARPTCGLPGRPGNALGLGCLRGGGRGQRASRHGPAPAPIAQRVISIEARCRMRPPSRAKRSSSASCQPYFRCERAPRASDDGRVGDHARGDVAPGAADAAPRVARRHARPRGSPQALDLPRRARGEHVEPAVDGGEPDGRAHLGAAGAEGRQAQVALRRRAPSRDHQGRRPSSRPTGSCDRLCGGRDCITTGESQAHGKHLLLAAAQRPGLRATGARSRMPEHA